jgi:DNA-binding LacI/PurR family transcriptional regulator
VNKLTAVSAAIEAKAVELGPGGKLPTFRDLQREMGVSRTTLSTALDSLESKGVLSRRHGVGIFASAQLHHRSLVLLANPVFFQGGWESDPFWPLLIQEAHERAKAGAESLAVQFLTPGAKGKGALPPSLVSDLENQKVDGILGVGLEPEEIHWVQSQNTPFVAYASMGRCTATFDHEGLVNLAVEELAKRGCRRIELWTAPRLETDLDDHGEADTLKFHAAQERLGLKKGPVRRQVWRRWKATHQGEPLSISLGALLAEEAMKSPDPLPDGVAILEDTVTRGVVPALMRRGIMAGRDLLIATHSNKGSSLLSGFEDMLIRLQCDPTLLVKELFRMLEMQMAGAVDWEENVVLKPTVAPFAPRP